MRDDSSTIDGRVPVRVLLVEDDPADAHLILHELRRSGFAPIGPRVETERDFLACLAEEWDLVISDYALPQFDALQALAHLTARNLTVPFIMVSGTVGEDVAVRAIQLGATDYLLKDRLGRLGEAVRRALADSRARREREAAVHALRVSEARLRLALSAAGLGSWEYDIPTGMISASETLAKLMGLPPGTTQYSYADAKALVHPDDLDRLIEADRRAIDDGLPYEVEIRILRPDGQVRWLLETGEVTERDGDGRARQMLGVSRDITDSKLAELALRRSEASLAEAQRLARLGSWEWDLTSNDLTWSDELYRVFGVDRGTWDATYEHILDLIHPDDRLRVDALVAASITNTAPFECEFRVSLSNGALRTVHARATFAVSDAGRRVVMRGTAQDITERKVLEEQLRFQAFHDSLTGLPNRALVNDRLTHALDRARRLDTQVAVLFIDFDNFKLINDGLGHGAGDEFLTAAARRLETTIREGDTAGRFGGDEFACVLEDLEDVTDAHAIADRIAARIRAPFVLDGREVAVTASIGIAMTEVPVAKPEDLFRHADLALYAAKRAGKARIVAFEPTMNNLAWNRLELEADLRKAVEEEQLSLVYQPIVQLATGRIVGAEALLRWQHPTRGPVSPVEFIPIAEETDLIFPLERWVLAAACRQAAMWQAQGQMRDLSLSVNLSARQFEEPALVEIVADTLTASGLAAPRLTLEITERVALSTEGLTTASLAALKALGVRLAVDDFGTGYSGLSALRNAPLDSVKIDRAFVAKLGVSERDTEIARAVVALAGALGMQTTAEGVETAEQAAMLRELGCTYAQGFHFARPLPAPALATVMSDQNALAPAVT
jgi:diguanylate cyclase (GGDEF)-like protein/PAS domain S-box-containing protein